MRTSIENIDAKFQDLGIKNLADVDVVVGEYVADSNNGIFRLFSNDPNLFKRTDYVPIISGSKIKVYSSFHYGSDGISFYDSNKIYISGYHDRTTAGKYIILGVPENACYFALSGFASDTLEVYYYEIMSSYGESLNIISKTTNSIAKDVDYLKSALSTDGSQRTPIEIEWSVGLINQDGYRHVYNNSSTMPWRISQLIPVVPNTNLYIEGKFNSGDAKYYSLWFYSKEGAALFYLEDIDKSSSELQQIEFTTPSDAYYISFFNRSQNINSVKLYKTVDVEAQFSNLNETINSKCNALSKRIDEFNLSNINNGRKLILASGSDISGTGKNYFSLEKTSNTSSSFWSSFKNPITVDDTSKLVYVEFDIKLDPKTTYTNPSLNIWLSDGRTGYASGCCEIIARLGNLTLESRHIKWYFDPAYYAVYKTPPWTEFNVWIQSDVNNGATTKFIVENLYVYQTANKQEFTNFDGNNVAELFQSIDDKLSGENEETSDYNFMEFVSPNGSRFEALLSDSGELNFSPIIPTNGAFFGNSLIGGSGFGMAASDQYHDYYYLINNFIQSQNSEYISNRYSASYTGAFEGLTSASNIDSAVTKMTDALSGEETLVSIQLGDNVNTEEKNAVFPESALALCRAIRRKCPKARVVWMGMWYGSTKKYEAIKNACNQTGCHYITFTDIIGADANSKIGNVQHLASKSTRTLENVTSVVENSTTNITVTFSVNNVTYESTLDVESHTLSGTTLTYVSEYGIITSSGVASHPGDEGFRRISNKFLYEMGLTTDPEYYKKE